MVRKKGLSSHYQRVGLNSSLIGDCSVPAPNSQTSTRSIFVLERQEVGSQEWQKCFTSETATSAEVTGDSVPCEGNYRFRVCCINKYGRSGHVEFPKVIHLGESTTVEYPSVDISIKYHSSLILYSNNKSNDKSTIQYP